MRQSRSQIIKLTSILFSFQLKNIFWKNLKFFGENPGTNQNFIANVRTLNLTLYYDDYFIALFYEIHDERSNNDEVQVSEEFKLT